MRCKLRCHPRYGLGDGRGLSRRVYVVDHGDVLVPAFELLCQALDQDIQSAGGSGAAQIENVRRIEHGETAKIEAGGNAWVTHLTRDKVWFEGLYGQGEGGEVSFAQYKLAVQTYVRFLSDPEHRTIEIVFPT
jgi:hypothetical protein